MALKLRRGTDSERTSIVFEEGEPVYVTDTGELYIGDGSTAGGLRVSNEVELDTSPALGGNLDLNGSNIVGTGNIIIDGNINAFGTINLGDGAEDNVIVGGQIASSLIPDVSDTFDLGTSSSSWREGYFNGINVDGEILGESIRVNSISSNDSTVVYDGQTQTLNVLNITPITDTVVISNPNEVDTGQQLSIVSNVESFEEMSRLVFTAESDIDLSSPFYSFGEIVWERNDVNGLEDIAFLRAGPGYITLGAGEDSESANEFANRVILLSGTLGIGVAPALDATEKLLVGGNAVVQGEVEASSFKGSLAADDSTIIIDSIDQIINSNQVRLNVLSTEILEPASGTVAVADGIGWDPASTGQETMVVYLNGAWQALA